jgi:hypothetical protein
MIPTSLFYVRLFIVYVWMFFCVGRKSPSGLTINIIETKTAKFPQRGVKKANSQQLRMRSGNLLDTSVEMLLM